MLLWITCLILLIFYASDSFSCTLMVWIATLWFFYLLSLRNFSQKCFVFSFFVNKSFLSLQLTLWTSLAAKQKHEIKVSHECHCIDSLRRIRGWHPLLVGIYAKMIGWAKMESLYYRKASLSALSLTFRNFATFQIQSEHGNRWCSWDVFISIPLCVYFLHASYII